MARKQSIDDEKLLTALSCVFRDVGYEGASLALLSRATGLQKASLYHRFPRGKQQMAQEVLNAALGWFGENIIGALRAEGPPAARLALVAERLDQFYSSGRQACLLNVLNTSVESDSPFAATIKSAFEALIDAFAALARDAGHSAAAARMLGERAVMLLHGGLVLSRGLGSSEPFRASLSRLGEDFGVEAPVKSGEAK